MKPERENRTEEITEFPEQNTFNYDEKITEEKDGETHDICHADK